MSLPLLIGLVAAGIGLIVLLIHLTGGTQTAVIADADAAVARFADDFPALKPRAVILAAGRHAAFLELGDGRAGLVQAVGDRFLTRIVDSGHAKAFKGADGALFLSLPDLTFRGGEWRFDGPQDASRIAGWLNLENGI